MKIRPFVEQDESRVIDLWARCGLLRPWNDPRRDIARKLQVQRELFLVGEIDERIVGVVMAGYDGHRGWVNYLGVDPSLRGRGLGRRLMLAVEGLLGARGCPKVALQVRRSNHEAIGFYESLGYAEDDVVSMGKRLVKDEDAATPSGGEGDGD